MNTLPENVKSLFVEFLDLEVYLSEVKAEYYMCQGKQSKLANEESMIITTASILSQQLALLSQKFCSNIIERVEEHLLGYNSDILSISEELDYFANREIFLDEYLKDLMNKIKSTYPFGITFDEEDDDLPFIKIHCVAFDYNFDDHVDAIDESYEFSQQRIDAILKKLKIPHYKE